jgi:hypothetical protein
MQEVTASVLELQTVQQRRIEELEKQLLEKNEFIQRLHSRKHLDSLAPMVESNRTESQKQAISKYSYSQDLSGDKNQATFGKPKADNLLQSIDLYRA